MRRSIAHKISDLMRPKRPKTSFLRLITSGKAVRLSSTKGTTAEQTIKQKIQAMRLLAEDAQIATALSYYATDSTTTNSAGRIIWATSKDDGDPKIAEFINALLIRWNVDAYARDHVLELATVGNLYIPTTQLYKLEIGSGNGETVALDTNTLDDKDFDIIPSYKLPTDEVMHLWNLGQPCGFIYQPEDSSTYMNCPESSIIHFALGGLLGDYQISGRTTDGDTVTYDVQFANPLLENAVYPTQTLNLLEDATLLAAFSRVIKFINVDCSGSEEEEIEAILDEVKQTIEQQLSINSNTGDAQSFLNPQSPNNLIYLPKVDGQDAVSITDLNMADSTESDNKLLDYYQNKKLSVLGIPKEAFNFSSAEGLGAAGTVMSQRSALYANILNRIRTAYIAGWMDGIKKYLQAHQLSGYIGKFELHMNPIVTEQSTVMFEKRDSALNQAQQFVSLMKETGADNRSELMIGLAEILTEAFPQIAASVAAWRTDLTSEGGVTDV